MITQFHGRTEAINIIYRTQNEVFINFKTLVAFYNSIMIAAMLSIGKRAISIITKYLLLLLKHRKHDTAHQNLGRIINLFVY